MFGGGEFLLKKKQNVYINIVLLFAMYLVGIGLINFGLIQKTVIILIRMMGLLEGALHK